MRDFGTVRPGTTLYIPFATYDSNDPSASVTLTGLATTDIEVIKDGSTTARSSDSGYALLGTDGIDEYGTGIHGISISLADNTAAGFYASGSQYWAVIASITVDGATINFISATWRIGYPDALLNTTIATLASQTSFTLTAGPAEDDALNGMWCVIHDVASAVQLGYAVISDYTGSTKTVTLAAGTTFTAAASDNIAIMGPTPLQPTTAGRTLGVESDGHGHADVKEWLGVAPLALTSQLVQAQGNQLGTQAKADVNAEVDSALDTAIPGTPTAGSVNDVLKDLDARLPGSGTLSILTAAAVNAEVVDVLTVDALTEAYAADGATFTFAQFAYMVWSLLAERNVASTTLTTNKLDGTTAAMTFTLDDATDPTTQTRAT